MSKGFIVMDIPENCEDCPCCHTDNYDFYCKRNGNHVDWEEKPDWCPIKPLDGIDLIDRNEVIRLIDRHTTEDGKLDNDITCILEEASTVFF